MRRECRERFPCTAVRRSRHASPHVRDSRAVMQAGIAKKLVSFEFVGEKVPGIPCAWATTKFTCLIRGQWFLSDTTYRIYAYQCTRDRDVQINVKPQVNTLLQNICSPHGIYFITKCDYMLEPVIHQRKKLWLASWWRHQMETFSALLALCEGISPGTGEFPSQSQWRGILTFSLIWARTNGWVNHRDDGDLRRHCAYYDVTVEIMGTITTAETNGEYIHNYHSG